MNLSHVALPPPMPALSSGSTLPRASPLTGDNTSAMSSQSESQDLVWDTDAHEDASSTTSITETVSHNESAEPMTTLSLFEAIITTYPPVLESLLSQIATTALLDLYHTSPYLRDFLRNYPLAWKTLSFRLPQPAVVVGSPGNETPDGRERQSKAYSFDALLKMVVQPYGKILTRLDLCNTAVSGIALVGSVLAPRLDTLQHLSVRGCKNVSIKYHIVPFLEPYTLKDSPWTKNDLALKSLYTYRCRHHRRRPYLPSSLIRRDSDSDPTHQLIEICHQLGIWTDTAWCPTPGGRCFRRKDYHAGRAGPQNMEVWVPFDRLWRSSNRLGPVDSGKMLGDTDGRLWEISETGQDGEPLGTEGGMSKGEGKHVPAHDRKSHRIFVDEIKCAQCSDVILERCESCSVRMHCMGCRKTLCASCAFNRPMPRKRVKTRHFTNLAFGPGATLGSTLSQASGSPMSLEDHNRHAKPPPTNRFWWAPGSTRSPNLMNESAHDEDSSDSEDGGNMHNGLPIPLNREPPKLNMHWCCLEPIFSGGGGIAVLGIGLGGRGADKIRAAPLPRTKQFEDPDFANQLRPVDYVRELKNNGLYEYVLGEDVDILSYLKQDSLDLQAHTCPRGLCQDCHRSFRWKVSCRACKNPLCKEHDFRALKFRKCGFRDMHTEREYARTHNQSPRLVIPEFNPNSTSTKDSEQTPTASSSSQQAVDDLDILETTLMSQSQILFPPTAPAAVDMSASTSLSSHASNVDAFLGSGTLPFVPVSQSRPRSFSASGVRSRNSGSWANSSRVPNPIANPLPLPCHPRHPVQWEGCGAYFCQYPRPVGDNRNQCPAVLKECTDCGVFVCDQCSGLNPTCTCSFCTVNFHCPHCSRKKEVKALCRLEDENQARIEAEKRAEMKKVKEQEEKNLADDMAETVYEFFTSLYETLAPELIDAVAYMGIDDNEDESVHGMDAAVELVVSSPDSITVTTEFGVSEEPSNTTTITGGEGGTADGTSTQLPPSSIDGIEFEAGTLEDQNQNMLNMGPALLDSTVPTEVSVAIDVSMETDTHDLTPDDGDDADIDTDDFDATDFDGESMLIDEFIDDGALTPITGSTEVAV
ncbi:hypothetical protein K504DRAFT_459561 [Pleomassaria siparia CBS 279.74]|uniref:Uncharacterized protein n=1 Tax=Pleomassaria siparia CBS 279.74 TaxID=1314801 RepID=A0A6G1K0Y2_9PLEO|nr:hypothetical protein K504DRAFT_459561 [Pleomassaria siparia CBS 279.74]